MRQLHTTLFLMLFITFNVNAQKTKIRGFMDINSTYNSVNGTASFGLGEQDLFITTDISDRLSFLGESVFKYSATSTSKFNVSLERAVFKYNFKGNHNFVAGKFHTPVNYWNDSYHHGRVFFPTIGRPELFNQKIIPIHTTGIGMMGENFGKLKMGYNLMIGNGLGSTDIKDNDRFKSYTIAGHMKPIEYLRIGMSAYIDKITDGSKKSNEDVSQQVYSVSVAYFNKFEFLGEMAYTNNSTDSLGRQSTIAAYIYMGYKIKDMIVPYVRLDYIGFGEQDMYYVHNKTNSYTIGVRYEINYLTALKFEYNYKLTELANTAGQTFNLQLALGF